MLESEKMNLIKTLNDKAATDAKEAELERIASYEEELSSIVSPFSLHNYFDIDAQYGEDDSEDDFNVTK